jgi:hypothetical protein
VKPRGIRPCTKEHYGNLALTAIYLVKALANPLGYRATIWWIAKHTLSSPILFQAVLFRGVVFLTLMILFVSTRIQGKSEFSIKVIKKFLRCFPQIRF